MNSSPLVSILVPLYNAEKYIVETLDSCVNQTYKNIEVVVVDDGSNDNSLAIAEEYALSHPQVRVISQKNGGGCKARNKAFANSKGEYIVYLDADDIISKDKIEVQVSILRGEPYTTVATCKWDRFYETPNDAVFPHLNVYKNYSSGIDLVEDLLHGGMFGVTCYMTSRQLIEEAGPWDENVLVNQDGEFFFRVLLRAKRILYSEKGALYYRSSDLNSTSRGKKVERKGFSLLYTYECEYRKATELGLITDKIKEGIVIGIQSVAYQYYIFPQIVKASKKAALKILPYNMPSTNGSRWFLMGASIIGFWNMLQIKQLLLRK